MKAPPEMSRKEFKAALARNGFSGPIMMWFRDLRNEGVSYGGMFTMKGKLLRRATIAHLIRSRAQHERAQQPGK